MVEKQWGKGSRLFNVVIVSWFVFFVLFGERQHAGDEVLEVGFHHRDRQVGEPDVQVRLKDHMDLFNGFDNRQLLSLSRLG